MVCSIYIVYNLWKIQVEKEWNFLGDWVDWSALIIARYNRHDKRSKLPGWILAHLKDAHLNLSTDMSLHIVREV